MSALLDARGNPFQGELDAIGNDPLTDARVAGATLTALGQVFLDLNGNATCMFDIRIAAIATATIIFEGSVDGSNYQQLPAFTMPVPAGTLPQTAEGYVSSIVLAGQTLTAQFMVQSAGFRQVRARVSAYTSGSIAIIARASRAPGLIYLKPIPSLQATSVQGVANTLATLTLATPPAGQFLYLTSLKIMRAGAAALAGTAVLAITTTNLLALAWTVGNASAAGGTQTDVDFQPAVPMKAATAASVSSVTMPAPGAGVLWSAQATYYFGA